MVHAPIRGMRLTTTMTILGLVVASGIACQAQTRPADDLTSQSLGIDCPIRFEIDGAIDYDCSPLDEGIDDVTPVADPGPDVEACLRISARAEAMIAAETSCNHDHQCDWTIPYDELGFEPCVPALQCYLPAGPGTYTPEFARELRALDDAYRTECGICPASLCADPDYVLSTCEQHACEIDVAIPVTETLAK